MDTLAERLKVARAERKLSQRGLGDAAGISGTAVLQLEDQTILNPRIGTVVALARALGVKAAWLAFGEGRRA